MKIKSPKSLTINDESLRKHFPSFLLKESEIEISAFLYIYYRFLLSLISIIIRFRLNIGSWFSSHQKLNGDLSNDAVERIYEREARTYERKHHVTTNYRDTWWRRQSATDVISYLNRKKPSQPLKLLDVATGVGLSIEEMFKVFKAFGVSVEAQAIDYNKGMLEQANKITYQRMKKDKFINKDLSVVFARGDARNLTNNTVKSGFVSYKKNTFDCVTIMFGIGGIDDPVMFFKETLHVLKKGGILSLNDMHKIIHSLDEKWPFYIFKKTANVFAMMAWNIIILPIVLNTLWGWRDTTPLFYILPFIVVYDEKEEVWYGFKTVTFFLDNEAWWYKLPTVPTARIVVEKEIIEKSEALRREEIFKNISWT